MRSPQNPQPGPFLMTLSTSQQTTSRRPCPRRPSSDQSSASASTSAPHPTDPDSFDFALPPRARINIDPSLLAADNAHRMAPPSHSDLSITDDRSASLPSLSRLAERARTLLDAGGLGDDDFSGDSMDDAGLPFSLRITREALFGTAQPEDGEGHTAQMRLLLERQARTEAQDAARRMMDDELGFMDSSDDEDIVTSVSRRWRYPRRRPAGDEVLEGIELDDSADDDEFADSLGRIQDLLPERARMGRTGGEGIWRTRGEQGVNAGPIRGALADETREIERINALRVAGARRTPAAFREELDRAAEGMGREGFEGAFAGFARRRRAQARDAGSEEAPATTTVSTETNTPRSSTPSIAIDTPASSLGASPTATSLCPPSPRASVPTTSAAIAEAAARDRRVRPLPSRTGSNDDAILPLTALGTSLSEEDRANVLQRLYSLAAARAEGRRGA